MKIKLGLYVWYRQFYYKMTDNNNKLVYRMSRLDNGKGIVVGVRYMPIGKTTFNYEEPPTFTRTGTEKFVLVSNSLFLNPRFVKEEDLIFPTPAVKAQDVK